MLIPDSIDREYRKLKKKDFIFSNGCIQLKTKTYGICIPMMCVYLCLYSYKRIHNYFYPGVNK